MSVNVNVVLVTGKNVFYKDVFQVKAEGGFFILQHTEKDLIFYPADKLKHVTVGQVEDKDAK